MKTNQIKNKKTHKKNRRHARVRAKVKGTAQKPRLSVYRSNRSVYAQLIDDINGVTLAGFGDFGIKKGTKTEKAEKVGEEIAKIAKAKKITAVVFDRGGFKYAGRIKALADSARNGGLQF